jgi:hypothetical protein
MEKMVPYPPVSLVVVVTPYNLWLRPTMSPETSAP